MKKYLILTVTAGEGHNSISSSIASKLLENAENEVKVLDIFKTYGKPTKATFINDGYIYACKYALLIYNMFFKMWQKTEPEKRYFNAAQTLVTYETPQLLKDIYEFQPDVIICAHFYCGIMVTNLRKMYEIPAKTISILFDYTVHPFWECAIGVDYLITPSTTLHPILEYKGYKSEQLIPLGIPVRQDFSKYISKEAARNELSLEPNTFTIMVMLGGGGFGGADKILKKLLKVKKKTQILVVNGKDEQSKKRIETIIESAETIHKIENYGFMKNIPTIMSASDVIVGKCGGVTVNESLNKKRVLILPTVLAQQEFDNMVYLSNNKCTIIYDEKYMKLENIIESAVENPHLLDKFEENIEKIRKPNALKDICDFAESFEKVEYKTIEEITKNDYAKIRRQIRKINSKEQIAEIKKKQYTKKLERLEKKLTLKEAKQEIRDNKKQEESKKKEIEKRLTNPKKIVRSMRGIQNSTKSRIKISKVKYK